MPGNIIQINHSKAHEWYVGDSKMPALMAFLKKNGVREKSMKKAISSSVRDKSQKVAPQMND